MGSHNFEIHDKGASEHDAQAEGHITPFNVYVKVACALFALTFLTVGAHAIHEHLQPFAALIAFAIAAVKAYLVMAFFMHLKYETKMNRAIFISGFLFLLLLFTICTLDIYTRLIQTSVL
ncbi:MAG: cytochrome C oxidase subunit IV family protein [Bdellovibrio sp.]|nr:cytochrome C oxidase subunit IV family protein [Bdellovibrio sp.]